MSFKNKIFSFLPDGGTEFSGTSIGVGIGGLRIGFLSYEGGGGIGLRDFGVESIEFKILSSDLEREKIEDDEDEMFDGGAMCRCRIGGAGGGGS